MQNRSEKHSTPKEPSKSKVFSIQTLFVYLVFPISQILTFLLFSQAFAALFTIPVPVFFIIIGIFLFLLVILVYLLYSKFAKKLTERSYRELSDMQQFQKEHYNTIQKQRLELEHLKSSFEQQLTTVSVFLEQEQPEQALDLLKTLSTAIASTKEYPFCANPVINAVLQEKEQQCCRQNIPFHSDIQLGDCTCINPMHLCSIFSNLLDNAIIACASVTENKFIHLTAKQSGDFIHVKLKNSSLSPATPKQGHGYGHRILKDIAVQYSGSFRTAYKNNVYETFFSIQTHKKEKG